MLNEYGGLVIECNAPELVPFGPGYDNSDHQACTVPGAISPSIIDGNAYLSQQYSYSQGHLWRGFGVLCGIWAFCIFLTAYGYEQLKNSSSSSSLVFKRGSGKNKLAVFDEEKLQSDTTLGTNTVERADASRNEKEEPKIKMQ